MHLFHIPQCPIQNRHVHISFRSGKLWDMEQVHSGICELGQLCDGCGWTYILIYSPIIQYTITSNNHGTNITYTMTWKEGHWRYLHVLIPHVSVPGKCRTITWLISVSADSLAHQQFSICRHAFFLNECLVLDNFVWLSIDYNPFCVWCGEQTCRNSPIPISTPPHYM